ncbi:MAG TPA: 5-dehydro-2-deoxygluconokinase [Actinomycetes bacterium]|nr:5-dehydro-2-deoxygluconokinase [Actinomycetes bacterium]
MPFDLVTIGRVGVDIYPDQVGVGLAEVEHFTRYLGGSATNVAVAAARLGLRSAVVTRTGADPFGDYVHAALRGFGVDERWVSPVPGLPTPVTFCAMLPPDDFPLYFYREPKAPDLEIRADELDLPELAAARVLWATVTGLCQEPSRTATLTALRLRRRTHPTVLDLDYRAQFWPSATAATTAVSAALPYVTVAVGNLDECEVAVGTRDPRAAGTALLDCGVGLAVVKLGPDGVLAMTRTEIARAAPIPVQVVNGLGAGDAFGGALCLGLLRGWPLARVLRFGNAAGAIVAGQIACSAAMPTEAEVDAVLAEVGLAEPEGVSGARSHQP